MTYIKEHAKRRPQTDSWLTPPMLVKSLGKFDVDPCCPAKMPWRTARKMVHFPEKDGLAIPWKGKVWCNPPYSDPMPWVRKMADHENGVMLLSSKGLDTRWGQLALSTCSAVMFMKGRILFYFIDGSLSNGKWMPTMLMSWDAQGYVYNSMKLLESGVEGVFMKRKI